VNRISISIFIAVLSIAYPASAATYLGNFFGFVTSGTHRYGQPFSSNQTIRSATGQPISININPNSSSGNSMGVGGAIIGGSVYWADLISFEETIQGEKYRFTAAIYDYSGNDGGFVDISGTLRNNVFSNWRGMLQMGGQAHEDNVSWSTIAQISFAYVPEPATWAMLIAGFGLVGAAMRRRNQAVASFA